MYIHNYSNIYRNDMSWNLKIPPNYPVLVSFSTDPTISSIFFWFSPAALNWTKLICFPWETKQIVEVIQSLIILEAVLLLLLCVSKILHPNCSAYISWNNGRILMFEKLEICITLIGILQYIEAKFDYGYFIIFLHYSSKIFHKKFQVISSKNKGVTLIFPIPNEIKIRKNRRHAFIFGRNDFRFFV